jgi:DHA2 family multidrug resistance protein-like MFS transporter
MNKKWIGLAVLALPTLLVAMDMTVMYLVIPSLSAALKPSSVELLWITDIYGFLQAGMLITMGTLGDRIGRRRLLMAGAVTFAFASALAAFSTSPGMLIASRALLGIAGASLMPSILSLIRNMFSDDGERTIAMGIWTTCFSAGTMLGPFIGGWLLHYFWWGSVFLMAVPVMLLFLPLGRWLLPESKHPGSGKIDPGSAALSIAGILAVVYGIKELSGSQHLMVPVIFVLAGLSILLLFLRRQHRHTDPLLDLSLFRMPAFNTALGALLIALFSWAGISLFVGQYLQLVFGLDPFRAGVWTVASAAGSILFCLMAPLAVRRYPRNYLMAAGLAVLAAGILIFTQVNGHLLLLVTASFVMGGCGLTVTLGSDMVISMAPPEKAGAAAAIYETSTTLGSALGIALLGSIWTASYHYKMQHVHPNDFPYPMAEAARNTLGEAIQTAHHLRGPYAEQLIHTARGAFVDAANLAAYVCAALVLVMAFFTASVPAKASIPGKLA